MWKILTTKIREDIFESLINRRMFPKEQKRCRKRTRSSGELKYIDQNIPKDNETRQKNLALVYIDYTKTYDMVP